MRLVPLTSASTMAGSGGVKSSGAGRRRSARGPAYAEADAERLAELLPSAAERHAMSEAIAYGEISSSGKLPKDGTVVEEIAALLTELRATGGVP
jgi:hypothetical protein